ncbi:MAG: Ger(x)C family spore germination C-terminal domain-containing protein [Eubacteriales bacterium]
MKESKEAKTLFQLFLVLIALLFLSSCSSYLPEAQEMGNMALLRSFGIDRGDMWTVSVSTGQQRKGSSQEDPVILSGKALTLQGACEEISGYTEDYVFFGYVDQLILGEELAESGIYSALNYFVTENQLSLGTGLWITLGTAEALIASGTDQGTGEHLETLTEESTLGISGITRKVGEVLADYHHQGASYVPILVPSEEEVLRDGGYGILVGDRLTSILEGDLSRGLSLLECHPQLVEMVLPEGAYAVELKEMSRKICPSWHESGSLEEIVISLEVQGSLVECPLTPREDITAQLEEKLSHLAMSTLAVLQEEGADVLHLQGEVSLASPFQSREMDWDFSQVTLKTEVHVDWI